MRLAPGGVREIHGHIPAEWSFMLAGKARITGVDNDGHNFVADVGEGDLWYFPKGIPHSIQGVPPDGAEFVLAFPDVKFSEDSTFAITDTFAHIPKELAKNFRLSADRLRPYPEEGEIHLQGTSVAVLHRREDPHDGVRRERQRAHVRFPRGRRRLRQAIVLHYFENTDNETLRFLEIFNSPILPTCHSRRWSALTPHELMQAHLGINRELIDALPRDKRPVV